jgi:hypothetical protein
MVGALGGLVGAGHEDRRSAPGKAGKAADATPAASNLAAFWYLARQRDQRRAYRTGMAVPSPLYWNAWLSRAGAVVDALSSPSVHEVHLDLSNLRFTESIAISATTRDYIGHAVAANENETRFRVRLSILGPTNLIAFDQGANTDGKMRIDLARYRKLAAGAGPAPPAAGRLDSSRLAALSAHSIGGFSAPIIPKTAQPACAQVAFTLWDDVDARPLDHVVFSFVVNGSAADYPALCRIPRLQGGFGAMNGALGSNGKARARAALYFFEYLTPPNDIRTKLVLVDTEQSAAGMPGSMRGWELDGSPATEISGKFFTSLITQARSDGSYEGAARELEHILFPADSPEAQQGLALLRAAPRTDQSQVVLARYVRADGRYAYLPLGLLNGSPAMKSEVTFVLPLQRESYADSCFDNWTFVYPGMLDFNGQDKELPWNPDGMLPKGIPTRVIRDLAGLHAYMEEAPAGRPPSRGEALLLLAHHADGRVWFKHGTSASERIRVRDARRVFGPGSIALLSACSAASVVDDNDVMLRQLNDAGADAILASPFPVDADYAQALSLALIGVIASDGGSALPLAELLDAAHARALSTSGIKRFRQMKYEFILAGNQNIGMCKLDKKGDKP